MSKEFPGKIYASTPYIIGKVVSRLEMDSRWALGRSVWALVAERDELKGKLESHRATRFRQSLMTSVLTAAMLLRATGVSGKPPEMLRSGPSPDPRSVLS